MSEQLTIPPARRVTPTAYRVLPADADRDTWLAARRNGIGSSDVAAIVGVSTFRTPVHVWHDKRGDDVDTAGEAALWGTLLEEPVAREWARRNRSVIQRVGLIAHHEQPWMLATLDRRVAECPLDREVRTACALEVKCRNAFSRSRWHASIPDDVLAQTTWQLLVTGYDHIHVAVLIGGNEYKQTVVRRDEQVAAFVAGEVARFREQYLLPDVEPPWDPERATAMNDLDAVLYPDRAGEVSIQELGAVMEYARVSAIKGAAERQLKAARADLMRLAAGAETVRCGPDLAFEMTPTKRSKCDLEALAERFPDAYAATVTTTHSHSIAIAKELKQKGQPV